MRCAQGAREEAERERARFLRLRLEEIYGGHALSPKRADVTLLAASIAKHGLLSPLVVQKNEQAGRYALVCGARRLAACRMLGLSQVDALLIDGDESEAATCYLEEHWMREGVSGVEEAETARQAGGEALLARLGVPEAMLLRRLRLAALGEDTLAFARDAGLTLEQTEPLLMIPREDRQLEAAGIIAQRGLSARQARRLIAGAPRMAQPSDAQHGEEGRRATRDALGELNAVAEHLRAQGMNVGVSVCSQEGGLLVQIALKNRENLSSGQEKKGGKEN